MNVQKITAVILASILAVSAFAAVSCGKKPEEEDGKSEVAANLGADAAKKQVYGEIYDIVGNLITVKEMEMPAGGIDLTSMLGKTGFGMEDFSGMSPEGIADALKERGINVPTDAEGNISMDNFSQNRGQRATGEDGQPVTGGFFSSADMPTNENGEIDINNIQIPTNADGKPAFEIKTPEPATDENGQPVTDENGNQVMNGGFKREQETDENGEPATDAEGNPVYKNRTTSGRQYTGKNIEVVIPVGVPIVSVEMGDDGKLKETEVSLDTLKTGGSLLFTYAEDGMTVEKVTIVPSTGGGKMTFNSSDAKGMNGEAFVTPEGNVGFIINGDTPVDGQGAAVYKIEP